MAYLIKIKMKMIRILENEIKRMNCSVLIQDLSSNYSKASHTLRTRSNTEYRTIAFTFKRDTLFYLIKKRKN